MESVSLLWPRACCEQEIARYAKKRDTLPDNMARDLDLSYIADSIYPGNGSYVLGILMQMCTDSEVIRYRQQVLRDFAQHPEFGHAYFNSLSSLYQFRYTVEAKSHASDSFVGLMSNIEGIATFIASVRHLAEFYAENGFKLRSQGLTELFDGICAYRDSEDFRTLDEQIQTLRQTLADTIQSVTIGINFNAVMKPVEAMILCYSNKPIKKRSLLASLLNKKRDGDACLNTPLHKLEETAGGVGLDRTLFNDLGEISKQLLNGFNIALKSCYIHHMDWLIRLENEFRFYMGAVSLMEDLKAHGLALCIPNAEEAGAQFFDVSGMSDLSFVLKLLRGSSRCDLAASVVANDLLMRRGKNVFLLTGPNNGGKTTFTRAVGIVQALFQAGLFVPAASARLSPTDWIYTHFPDREQIGVNTSRLATECRQFKTTFETATRYSLLLLNESISSTTIAECMVIAEEILRIIRYIGCGAVYTTHLVELVDRIRKIESSASGESRITSLVAGIEQPDDPAGAYRRTYKITEGSPLKTSYAQDIFRRFGIDLEQVQKKHGEKKRSGVPAG